MRIERQILLLFAGLKLLAVEGRASAQAVPDDESIELGGVVRSRSEVYDGRLFGSPGPGDEDYILWRALAHADLRPDEDVRVFVQLGFHEQTGRVRGPAPTDQNRLDLHQAWAEARVAPETRVRIGRQELAFGSARLVSTRDGPNIRRAFDAGLLDHVSETFRIRAFVARPVDIDRGSFDDGRDDSQLFGGVYVTRAFGRGGIDLYWFGLERENARFSAGKAREERHSFGARLYGKRASLDYDLEGVVQIGSFGDADISAWTFASNTGWTIAGAPFSPRLGLKANITSGDHDPSDGTLGTFNPLFPNLSYFSDAAFLAPQNHIDIHPHATIPLAAGLEADLGLGWFWKTESADAVYRGPGIPVGGATRSNEIGRQVEIALSWIPVEHVSLRVSAVRFKAGNALREFGGEDTNFGMLSVDISF